VQAASFGVLRAFASRFGKFEPTCERIVECLEGTPGISGPVTIKDLLEKPAWQVQLVAMNLDVATRQPHSFPPA